MYMEVVQLPANNLKGGGREHALLLPFPCSADSNADMRSENDVTILYHELNLGKETIPGSIRR